MRPKKASAMVFVDDFVLGTLPEVSVVTGKPAAHHVQISRNVRPLGGLWFLVLLLGPVGWIGFALAAHISRVELSGLVPVDDEGLGQIGSALVRARCVIALGAVVVVVAGVGLANTGAGAVLLALGLGIVAVGGWREVSGRGMWPQVRLDGSRRWVTLVGVHPDFAAACEQQQPSTRQPSYR